MLLLLLLLHRLCKKQSHHHDAISARLKSSTLNYISCLFGNVFRFCEVISRPLTPPLYPSLRLMRTSPEEGIVVEVSTNCCSTRLAYQSHRGSQVEFLPNMHRTTVLGSTDSSTLEESFLQRPPKWPRKPPSPSEYPSVAHYPSTKPGSS